MMSTAQLLAFTAMAFVVIVVPGPSVLFIVGKALAHGRRYAMASLAGNTLGAFVLVLLVAFGVGTVVEKSIVALMVLKLAGAAYLIFLGVKAWRARGATTSFDSGGRQRGAFRTSVDGFVVGVTNPKTLVFFTAALPQFVDPHSGWVPLQMLLLGLIFLGIAAISDATWGMAAAAARNWFGRSPRRMRTVGGAGGISMITLGVTLAVTGNSK
ncbi:LysE family translocator [Stackebrandtia nassauensis]|uniref:Lysine exporter protein (LYSE/YGGA) n=1 Tax=Stackebrandtia nassauensis (strain DSM 44728 / CIP 108903 / NRRL B-16338 / NBRC 102104 / LLR-40K-21) TaxID=446470 RepID=D3Q2P4_STANL|nr:LysE family translocator [Stackebrandtia nassauensis]ADD45795.1 Lysine exporter protein (LYSE/YGGA) [Stackebrandtia nassauensis DSM 44728]